MDSHFNKLVNLSKKYITFDTKEQTDAYNEFCIVISNHKNHDNLLLTFFNIYKKFDNIIKQYEVNMKKAIKEAMKYLPSSVLSISFFMIKCKEYNLYSMNNDIYSYLVEIIMNKKKIDKSFYDKLPIIHFRKMYNEFTYIMKQLNYERYILLKLSKQRAINQLPSSVLALTLFIGDCRKYRLYPDNSKVYLYLMDKLIDNTCRIDSTFFNLFK